MHVCQQLQIHQLLLHLYLYIDLEGLSLHKKKTEGTFNLTIAIIRPGRDKENQLFVHVIDEAPIFKISGFINSSKVLGTGQYLTTFGLDRPACHSVPLNLLNDINEIKKI